MTSSHFGNRLRWAHAAALWIGLVAGCGGDDGPDPGDGTGALLVTAEAKLEEGITDLEVRVARGGQELDGAVVTLRGDGLDPVVLPPAGGGRYRANQGGYARGYTLRVEEGADFLVARAVGPELHTVGSPAPGATIDAATTDLQVTWSGAAAEVVEVDVGRFESGELRPDPGELLVPRAFLDEDRLDVEITRGTTLVPAGGAAGSRFDVKVKTTTPILVLNSP